MEKQVAFYSLEIQKTEAGLTIKEDGNFSQFEIVGILEHIQQIHCNNLAQEMKNYEETRNATGK